MRIMQRLFALLLMLWVLAFCLSSTPPSYADTLSDPNYLLQTGDLDMSDVRPPSSSNTTTHPNSNNTNQIIPSTWEGTNYQIVSGFDYMNSFQSFTFSISQPVIDFGILSATNPVTRTNTLTVANGSAPGYQVVSYENHQLNVSANGSFIPDTTCDNGSCSEVTPALWSNSLTYGFGYRCDNLSGNDCVPGFSLDDYYRQFADSSKGEAPQSIMAGADLGQNKQAQITYKVNVSKTQPAGQYSNTLVFVATPTF